MSVSATSSGTTATTAATSATTSSGAAATTTKSFATLFAKAEDDLKKGETLKKVTGHHYAEISGGTRDKMFINLTNNARTGEAFGVVARDGKTFHVYGTGKDKVVVQVGGPKGTTTKSADSTTSASGTTSSGTSSSTTGTDTSSSTGTTSSSASSQ